MATKVKLRQKGISKGRKSLYLDFYPAIPHPETGKPTRREFINMYLIIDKKELKKEVIELKKRINIRESKSEKVKDLKIELNKLQNYIKSFKGLSPIDKRHNIETLNIGKSIRQKRENYLNKPEIYSQFEKEQLKIKELGKQCFVKYFEKLTDKRSGSNYGSWRSTLKYLRDFTNEKLKFSDLNVKFLEDFKEHLLTTKSNKSSKSTLSQNSAVSYFNKVKVALKQAYKDGVLQTDLNAKISPIKTEETRRDFLTLEELTALIKAPCNNDLLKHAAIFSALTGMAFKEIQNMVWGDITYSKDNGYIVLTKRQKSQRDNYLPIPEQAYNLLGESKEATIKVFEDLKYSAYHNKHLFQWIGSAGITKDITFHCFRHTYATLQLSAGTDLYVVSKMLGHKNVKTTQIYGKIVDKLKQETVNKIKLDFNPGI